MWLSMCLLAVLGSQGIVTVVKSTSAIFFRTVNCAFDNFAVFLAIASLFL